MKKVTHTIRFTLVGLIVGSMAISCNAQLAELRKGNQISPVIVSTDFLSPVSIGVEKVVNARFGIKARYHYLILFNQITSSHRVKNQNFIAELKYYPLKFKACIANPYISVYGKQIYRTIVEESQDNYSFTRTTAGLNLGIVSVTKNENGTFTGDVNIGLWQRLSAYSNDYGYNLGMRINIGVGIAF